MKDIFEILRAHRSIRKYESRPIAEELLSDILESARQAPTSSNLQAYSIVIIRDPVKKRELAHLCGDQPWVESCQVFLAICPDLHRLDRICRMRNYNMNDKYIELFVVAVVDSALVAENILVAAEASGLGACMIGGIRNNPDQVCRLLKLPERVFPLMGMCLGYPDQEGMVKPRLPNGVVVHHEEYDDRNLEDHVAEYDRLVKSISLYDGPRRKIVPPDGRAVSDEDYGWSEHTARRLASNNPRILRTNLKSFLDRQKFGLK
jgi:nitroreductase